MLRLVRIKSLDLIDWLTDRRDVNGELMADGRIHGAEQITDSGCRKLKSLDMSF